MPITNVALSAQKIGLTFYGSCNFSANTEKSGMTVKLVACVYIGYVILYLTLLARQHKGQWNVKYLLHHFKRFSLGTQPA